jgi:hypothetical protein
VRADEKTAGSARKSSVAVTGLRFVIAAINEAMTRRPLSPVDKAKVA